MKLAVASNYQINPMRKASNMKKKMSQYHPARSVHFEQPDPELGKSLIENEQQLITNKTNAQITVQQPNDNNKPAIILITMEGYGKQLVTHHYEMDCTSSDEEESSTQESNKDSKQE